MDENISDKKIIYKYCTPEFLLKKFFNKRIPTQSDSNFSIFKKNDRIKNFFNKLESYKKILDEKIKIGDCIKKYVKYSDDINIDLTKTIRIIDNPDFSSIASYGNYFKNIKTLIKTGVVHPMKIEYAFMVSVKRGNCKMVDFLIKNGVNITARNNRALRISDKKGYIEIIKLLINTGLEYYCRNEIAMYIILKYNLVEFYEKFNIR
jgi:hypothetical protein